MTIDNNKKAIDMYRHDERGELLPCSSQQSSKSKIMIIEARRIGPSVFSFSIAMAYCKFEVASLLMHWSYYSLVLSHWFLCVVIICWHVYKVWHPRCIIAVNPDLISLLIRTGFKSYSNVKKTIPFENIRNVIFIRRIYVTEHDNDLLINPSNIRWSRKRFLMFGRQMAYACNENCTDESGSNNNFYWIP